MAHYVVAREGATPVADASILALTTAANEEARIDEVFIGGEATSSTVDRFVIRRSATNGVGPTGQTPGQLNPTSPAAQTGGATTWGTTEPVNAGTPALWTTALNVFGGVVRWVAAPGQEMVISDAGTPDSEVSLESTSGTGDISVQILFEEP